LPCFVFCLTFPCLGIFFALPVHLSSDPRVVFFLPCPAAEPHPSFVPAQTHSDRACLWPLSSRKRRRPHPTYRLPVPRMSLLASEVVRVGGRLFPISHSGFISSFSSFARACVCGSQANRGTGRTKRTNIPIPTRQAGRVNSNAKKPDKRLISKDPLPVHRPQRQAA